MYEIKRIPDKLFISSKTTLTIPDIPDYAQHMMSKLMMETIRLGLKVTGPAEFHYFGSDGDLDTLFDMRICIPIEGRADTPTTFEYYESEPFNCASYEYHGNVYGVGDKWKALVESVMSDNVPLVPQSREVYRRWMDANSNKNITELQVGLEVV